MERYLKHTRICGMQVLCFTGKENSTEELSQYRSINRDGQPFRLSSTTMGSSELPYKLYVFGWKLENPEEAYAGMGTTCSHNLKQRNAPVSQNPLHSCCEATVKPLPHCAAKVLSYDWHCGWRCAISERLQRKYMIHNSDWLEYICD